MYVDPQSLLRSLRIELVPVLGDEAGEASAAQGIRSAVRLLEVREEGGAALLKRRLATLAAVLKKLQSLTGSDAAWQGDVARLREECRKARRLSSRADLEDRSKRLWTDFEALTAALAARPDVPLSIRTQLALKLGAWEAEDRRLATTAPSNDAASTDTRITQPGLERYLRDRFGEPDMRLFAFRQLSGGFGKETFLLDIEGKALNGGFVLRRDPMVATIDNDCHYVRNEYPVIKAAFARGFPAPDAVWLDTEHPLLPGGDFMVMRRASGATGGNVFGSTETLSEQMVEVLASAMAGLHGLPPLEELGDLTESIRHDSWRLSMRDSIHQYVRGWFDLYLREAHNPSPTLASLYGWMLDNVPDVSGRPALVHGDIGFHNMLIDQGRLTAVVDWEFAHVGDPAEDVGAARNSSRNYSWDVFTRHYRAAGGPEIDPVRLHYFRVWQHVRNASASNLAMGKFATGKIPDLKLAYTGHFHFPIFIQAACDLVAAGPLGEVTAIKY
jgi:aminoglycoside phosphotransferase (APT) family kinase protein